MTILMGKDGGKGVLTRLAQARTKLMLSSNSKANNANYPSRNLMVNRYRADTAATVSFLSKFQVSTKVVAGKAWGLD